VPSAPNLTFINKKVHSWCTNPGYISVDTFLVINTGGTARDLEFLVASRFWTGNPNTGSTQYAGWLDTANFFIRIGKNGTKIHPTFTLTGFNSGNQPGCTWTNRPAQLSYKRPFLNTGDTLYGFIAQQYCTENIPCGNEINHVDYRPTYPGTMYDLTYKNACGNIGYSAPRQMVRAHEAMQVFWTNLTEDVFYCGTKQDIILKNDATINQNHFDLTEDRGRKAYYDFIVNLPSALIMDASYSSIQQVRYVLGNGTIIYPYFQPSSNTWRFKANDIAQDAYNGKWIVKVEGAPASAAICTGVLTYELKMNVLHDSTLCSPTGNTSQLICNTTPFTYYGCNVCCPTGGLALLNATFQRTTLGGVDNDNNSVKDLSGFVDTTLIKRNRSVKGDTLRAMIKTLVVTNGTNTQWENLYFGTKLSGITQFDLQFIKASALIKRPSSTDTVMNLTSYTYLPNDTLLFDLSAVSNLIGGDTVIFNLYYKDNLPLTIQYPYLIYPFYYASHSANPSLINRFACGNAIIGHTHYQLRNLITLAGSGTLTSCDNYMMNGSIYNYVGQQSGIVNVFPYEYRPLVFPYRAAVKLPTGYSVDSFNFTVGLRYSSPIYYSIPFTIVGDSIVINFTNLYQNNGGPVPIYDEASDFHFRFYLKPSCKITPTITQNTGSDIKFTSPTFSGYLGGEINLQHQLTYLAPSLLLNSPTPIYLGYTKTANWPITITNASTQTVPNVWMYIEPKSTLPVDSVKVGSALFTPDANGFYRLGTFTGNEAKNYTVFTKNLACTDDSLTIYMGYGCAGYPTSFTPTTCNFAPRKLYIQPQPAAIQTQITALASTPLDPANPSGGNFGSSSIYMCQGFPFEMELQATQPGNLYDVKETLTLPFNGGTGLDYISDSGYIEYPIGTTPRRFSATANSAILTQVPGGTMTLDLAQIDPTNFGSGNALLGTGLGTNNTRRVILRWKMKSNCNLVNGDQWQATQLANSPCGAPAAGNSTVTSGYLLSLTGVTRPYVANLKVSTGLDGCGAQSTQIRIEKIGAGAPQPTDSITVRLPKTVSAGSVTCSGTACPAGAIVYTTRTDALYQYITFPYPSSASSTGDTLLYSFPMTSRDKATCANNQTVKADVFQQLTIYCGSPIPANLCPNAKNSLGSETKSFDIRKAILSFDAYSSTYVYPSTYKYRFGGNVLNTSSYVATGTGITLKTFMDVNNNLTYEKGIDALVRTTVLSSAIPTNGSVSFNDSFVNSSYSPSPSLPMYTVIDTGDASANCFCGGIVQSAFNQALPIQFIDINANNLNNLTGKIQWVTNSDANTIRFDIYRKTENEVSFKKVGYVMVQNGNFNKNQYVYYDPISNLTEGRVYYQIEAISKEQINKLSKVVFIVKKGALTNYELFTLSPNPSQNFVKVSLGEGLVDAEVIISDIKGTIVYQGNFKGTELSIKTTDFSQGVYSVSIKTNEFIEVQKLSIIK
jgi:hypothetical protein